MIGDIYNTGSLTAAHKAFSQFAFDLEGNIERDSLMMSYSEDGDGSLDSLAHLLGDPFDYMYDIVWESNF